MTRTTNLIAILAAAALALGMVPQLASAAAPTSPQDDDLIEPEDVGACGSSQLPQTWNGFIQLATPSFPGTGLTVTELFYFFLAERAPVPLTQTTYNGVDAYVHDLGCVVESQDSPATAFCVSEEEPDTTDVFLNLQYGNLEDVDFSVAYLNDNERVEGVDEDPTACEDFPTEAESVPTDTRYVILYVDGAYPKGLQSSGLGIYSTYFCAQVGQPADTSERCGED